MFDFYLTIMFACTHRQEAVATITQYAVRIYFFITDIICNNHQALDLFLLPYSVILEADSNISHLQTVFVPTAYH